MHTPQPLPPPGSQDHLPSVKEANLIGLPENEDQDPADLDFSPFTYSLSGGCCPLLTEWDHDNQQKALLYHTGGKGKGDYQNYNRTKT